MNGSCVSWIEPNFTSEKYDKTQSVPAGKEMVQCHWTGWKHQSEEDKYFSNINEN